MDRIPFLTWLGGVSLNWSTPYEVDNEEHKDSDDKVKVSTISYLGEYIKQWERPFSKKVQILASKSISRSISRSMI